MRNLFSSVLVCAAVLTACASRPSQKETKATEAKETVSAANEAPSSAQIEERYTIQQMDAAANLLKVLIDENPKAPGEDVGSDIVGCGITGQAAKSMTMPLKALIDRRLQAERDAYAMSPTQYASERGFESCGSTCGCGVLGTIIEEAETGTFKAKDLKFHERWLARLNLKARSLDARASKACASHQQWFCTSDLKRFLEKQ